MNRLIFALLIAAVSCTVGLSTAFAAQGQGGATGQAVASAADNSGHGAHASDPFTLSPASFTEHGAGRFKAAAGFGGNSASKAQRCDNNGNADEHNKHCQ